MLNICQRYFTKKSAEKLFFSPYIKVLSLSDSKIYMERTDTHNYVVFSASSAHILQELIQCIQNGITILELETYLKQAGVQNCQEWIAFCIQKGVIE